MVDIMRAVSPNNRHVHEERIIMKIIYAIVIALLISACSHSVSEKDVNDFMAKADGAIAAKNADEFAGLMSNSVLVNMSISQNGTVENTSLGKAAYIELLRQSWVVGQDYRFERTNVKISIQGNKATITDDMHESMVVQGKQVSSNSKETTILIREQGKLVISRVDASVSM